MPYTIAAPKITEGLCPNPACRSWHELTASATMPPHPVAGVGIGTGLPAPRCSGSTRKPTRTRPQKWLPDTGVHFL
jgi:hypothetical protein